MKVNLQVSGIAKALLMLMLLLNVKFALNNEHFTYKIGEPVM